MIVLKSEELKKVCSSVLQGVDVSGLYDITEIIQIKIENNNLIFSVTNGEYYLKYTLNVDSSEVINASVNAKTFLKLVSKVTSETISMEVKDNNLIIEANGTYKLPIVYKNDVMLEVEEIDISNVTSTFQINSDILKSIWCYNTSEISKGVMTSPVQKLYYVDEKGCITFTTGACVNYFSLPTPVKLLFNKRLVNLLRLFEEEVVNFELGQDSINGTVLTKVRFKTDSLTITSLLNSDPTLLSSVPAEAIRDRAEDDYKYVAVINRQGLINSLDRLSLFVDQNFNPFVKLNCEQSNISVSDLNGNNVEILNCEGGSSIADKYEMLLGLNDLKNTLSIYSDDYISFNFGNHQAVVISKNNIKTIIPEVTA